MVMAAGARSPHRIGPVGPRPRRLLRLTQVCVGLNGVVRYCQMQQVVCPISAQPGGVSVNRLYGFEPAFPISKWCLLSYHVLTYR
jgi:hypothetical protein